MIPAVAGQPDYSSQSPKKVNLGCDTDKRDGWINVDQNPDVDPDIVADVTDTPWDWLSDDSVWQVEARHILEHLTWSEQADVFAEVARVLEPGGLFRVIVPTGVTYRTDGDHETRWTYETPELFCQKRRRNWDPDVPFTLTTRRYTGWFVRPLSPLNPVYRLASRLRLGLWATETPLTGGELTAVYRRASDED